MDAPVRGAERAGPRVPEQSSWGWRRVVLGAFAVLALLWLAPTLFEWLTDGRGFLDPA